MLLLYASKSFASHYPPSLPSPLSIGFIIILFSSPPQFNVSYITAKFNDLCLFKCWPEFLPHILGCHYTCNDIANLTGSDVPTTLPDRPGMLVETRLRKKKRQRGVKF